MTTIVYRDGVMAADSRAWSGGHTPIGSKTKVRRLPSGILVGVASSFPGGAEHVVKWYQAGCDPEAKLPEDYTLLAVEPDGRAYYSEDKPFLSGPLTAPYYAISSGRQFALGALVMGADAVRAVEVGIELDTCSGGQIVNVTHKENPA